MPYNMNTDDGGIDGECNEYRHQWTPTHLLPSSQTASAQCSSEIRQKPPGSSRRSGNDNVVVGGKGCGVNGTHPKQTMSLDKNDSILPVPLSNSNLSSSHGGVVDPISAFEQQEKVKVRLVENRGLVVEDTDDDTNDKADFRNRADTRASFSLRRPSSSSSSYSTRKVVNCLKNSNRTTCPGHSSKIAISNGSINTRGGVQSVCASPPPFPPPAYFEENEQNQKGGQSGGPLKSSSCANPFMKPRHGSVPAGISSLTPLMTGGGGDQLKDSHKIPVIVKSSSSLKHHQGGSNIHLYCALVLGFSASLFFSLTLLLAKVLKNREHHPISIAFWRYLGVMIISIPLGMIYIFRGKTNKVVGSIWPIHDMDKAATALALLMRGVLGSTAVILRFCSLKYLTIGETSVISYCAPVFAAIVAPFCIRKDKGGVIPILVGVIAAFGVFLLCRPPFLGGGGDSGGYNGETLKGVFLASLSMLCTSGVLIIVRNLLQKVHFSLSMFVLGIWGVFEAGVLALSLDVLRVPQLLPDILMLFGVAILTFFGQLFVLLAIRMGQVGSAVSVMRSCDIFFSFLWQYLFLKTEPEIFSILSATLIILAAWFICFRKWLINLRENHSMRQRLSLMLY